MKVSLFVNWIPNTFRIRKMKSPSQISLSLRCLISYLNKNKGLRIPRTASVEMDFALLDSCATKSAFDIKLDSSTNTRTAKKVRWHWSKQRERSWMQELSGVLCLWAWALVARHISELNFKSIRAWLIANWLCHSMLLGVGETFRYAQWETCCQKIIVPIWSVSGEWRNLNLVRRSLT